jgi:protein-S-isoprenylcysteine O-methyltransferase Ste14
MTGSSGQDKPTGPAADAGDHAQVIAHPPLLALGGILVGLGLDAIWPAPQLPALVQYVLGGGLFLAGLVIVLTCALTFARAGTSVPTNTPTTALATNGLYRYSRNPIYVALALAHLGIAAAVDSPWILATLPVVLVIIRFGVIAREERYLEAKFGDEYRAYKARVRRWI